jgi:hypothetical protein
LEAEAGTIVVIVTTVLPEVDIKSEGLDDGVGVGVGDGVESVYRGVGDGLEDVDETELELELVELELELEGVTEGVSGIVLWDTEVLELEVMLELEDCVELVLEGSSKIPKGSNPGPLKPCLLAMSP